MRETKSQSEANQFTEWRNYKVNQSLRGMKFFLPANLFKKITAVKNIMTVHYCFDSKRIYVLTAKMVSLMTEDGEGKSTQKRGSCHSYAALGQEVI